MRVFRDGGSTESILTLRVANDHLIIYVCKNVILCGSGRCFRGRSCKSERDGVGVVSLCNRKITLWFYAGVMRITARTRPSAIVPRTSFLCFANRVIFRRRTDVDKLIFTVFRQIYPPARASTSNKSRIVTF